MRRRLYLWIWQLTTTGLVLATGATVCAQNIFQDYGWNRRGYYSPNDPWQKGLVFRTHTGQDGLFYNCDGEEDKRCSPWIHWPQRPCDDLLSLRRVHEERVQTIRNAVNRVQMGSCHSACAGTWGTGFPPGAGYGVEPVRRPRGAGYLPPDANGNVNGNDPALGTDGPAVEDSSPGVEETAPPEPVPALDLGQRPPALPAPRIVDLPAINHLKQVPRH
jgi:hypothetical protein